MDHPFSPTKHVEDPPPLIRRVDAFEVIECRTRTLDQTPKRKANPKIAMLPVVPANGGEPPEALPPMCPSDRCFGVSLSLSRRPPGLIQIRHCARKDPQERGPSHHGWGAHGHNTHDAVRLRALVVGGFGMDLDGGDF